MSHTRSGDNSLLFRDDPHWYPQLISDSVCSGGSIMNEHTITTGAYTDIIEEIRTMMLSEISSPHNMMDPSFYRFHINSVERYALDLATHFGAQKELVHIAALIHDISAIRDFEHLSQHHLLGAVIATEFLKGRIPDDACETIADAIRNHNSPVIDAAPESVVLSHADAMSKFDAPVYWIAYALKRRFATLDESLHWYSTLLSTTYAMMEPVARKKIEEKYAGVQIILKGLSMN